MSESTMSILIEPRSAVRTVVSTPAPPIIAVRDVAKSYGSGLSRVEVLSDIDLDVAEGEFVAIVGFSGSGKTTLMQMLAGLIKPDRGQIKMDGKVVNGPGPDRGLVFQNYSLLPWLTVRGNIALSVDCVFAHWTKAERREHVERFIEMVGLSHAAHRRPGELSGGMRQRTSLARTLAMKPRVLLLDEPLSALDALTRSTMQEEILRIWEEERQTCVMITNDVDEAIFVADRIIPLNPGPRATLGPAFDVALDRPRSRTELNHDPAFKNLRNAITNYLVDVRTTSRRKQARHAAPPISRPDIRPRDMALPLKETAN
jgi:nitrate/nitrite transport system ATP-binding protein